MSSLLGAGLGGAIVPGSQGGGLVLVEQHTANNSASLNFTTGVTATYNAYLMVIDSYVCATSGSDIQIALSSNAGGSWINTLYAFADIANGTQTALGGNSNGATTSIFDIAGVGNATGANVGGIVWFHNLNSASAFKFVRADLNAINASNNLVQHRFAGVWSSGTPINAIQVIQSAGNITSGTVRLYGLANN